MTLRVSVFANARDTRPKDCTISTILETIRNGKKLEQKIQQIRNKFESELTRHGDYAKAKKAVGALKNKLPAVTWSARLKTRAADVPLNEKLVEATGRLCFDFDGLHGELPGIWEKLTKSEHLEIMFRSPTRDGIKPVFCVPPDASQHEGSFLAVRKHIVDLCGEEVARKLDEKASDITRLCFLSSDPDLYHNPNAVAIVPLAVPEKPEWSPSGNDRAIDISIRQRESESVLGKIEWETPMRGYLVCPGKHLHRTADGDRDCRIDLDGIPTAHCFHSSCAGIIAGVNRELHERITKAEFVAVDPIELEREEVRSENDGSAVRPESPGRQDISLTSLTAAGEIAYPAPLGKAAFFGLAGDVVNEILPITEADEAAILFQFLLFFGNVIGRNAHMVADGVPHYCNLNAVLVGPTSKARKGSSRWRVRRLFQEIDEHWVKDCGASGLSSGEGLIWAIRDPITKLVKDKKTKTHELVTIDEGVPDKRLLVTETEFANVLKVMIRETNTLSVIMRQAWDCEPCLRTLVKNSPARASDPHVSVIGHITKEELRALLAETEMANGFGNRHLWPAVRRSKCLPEGGNGKRTETKNFKTLAERLRRVVEFAKTAGELKRDEAARKLWAEAYKDLSSSKPGLVGAINARAEAQTLRFQQIYALLDFSRTIRVEHLEAALECNRYSEDSARWIFGSGTGNKIADRILAALLVAGKRGMTKTEISVEVFNKNVSRFGIDEALRLLFHQQLAFRTVEETGGRPAETWFYNG